MKPHHHNAILLISLLLTLAFALFGLGGAPVAASVPPGVLATRTPTRTLSKATPTISSPVGCCQVDRISTKVTKRTKICALCPS